MDTLELDELEDVLLDTLELMVVDEVVVVGVDTLELMNSMNSMRCTA